MCGYYYSYNIPIDGNHNFVSSIKYRGPEFFDCISVDNEYYGHALLNTRGASTPQPIQNKHGILVYNGSTYNSKDNDTQYIINNLDNNLNRTIDVIKSLIGEYSLTYITNTHIVFAVDQWATKNLYFYYDEESKQFVCGSTMDFVLAYSPFAVKAELNKIYIIDKSNFKLTIIENTEWNLQQKTNNYDKVFEDFEQAIKDRHEPGITTYMLSAGVDAGVNACCARKFFNSDMFTVSKIGREDARTLGLRLHLQKKPLIDKANDLMFNNKMKEIFKQYNCMNLHGTHARALISILSNHFLPNKQKICISGIGGDELYDDYSLDKVTFGRVGKINGSWPKDLRLIYPWFNYEFTRLNNQLHRSDTICGHFGIEARYPLLDQRLFQSFLNTTVELKNSGHKHWLVTYMKENKYPFQLEKTRFASDGHKF